MRALAGYVAAALTSVGICCLLEWLHPGFFYREDAQLSFAPAYVEIARAWLRGEVPLLTPYCWHSTNLSGMYQYGLFSVLHQLLLVAVSVTGSESNRCFCVAAFYAGVATAGYFRLTRGWGWPDPLCWSASVTAALNGWIVCRGYADMQSHVISFAWVPWLWWALETNERTRIQRVTLWLSLYLAVAGGFYVTDMVVAILVLGFAAKALYERDWPRLLDRAVACFAAGGMALPGLAYFLLHARDGVRSLGLYTDWRLHPLFLATMFLPCTDLTEFGAYLPDHYQQWTMRTYLFLAGYDYGVGFVPNLALVLGCVTRPRELLRRRPHLWLLLVLSGVLACIPSVGGARASIRWCQLLLPVVALLGHEAILLIPLKGSLRRRAAVFLGPYAVPAAVLILCAAGVPLSILAWMALPGLLLGSLWAVFWFLFPRWGLRFSCVLSVAVLASTLSIQMPAAMSHGSPTGFIDSPAQARPLFRLEPRRVYLTLYDQHDYLRSDDATQWNALRPGNRAMAEGVRVLNGFDPTEPRPLVDTVQMETGGTMPDLFCQSLIKEAHPGGLLESWGVDGLLVASRFYKHAMAELPQQGWQEVGEGPPLQHGNTHMENIGGTHLRGAAGGGSPGRTSLWQRPQPLPEFSSPVNATVEAGVPENLLQSLVRQKNDPPVSRFLPDRAGEVMTGTDFGSVQVSNFQGFRNGVRAHVKTEVGQMGLLVLRRVHIVGYRARLNGKLLPTGIYNGVNLAVVIPGNQDGLLEVDFQPISVGALAAVVITALLLGLFWSLHPDGF